MTEEEEDIPELQIEDNNDEDANEENVNNENVSDFDNANEDDWANAEIDDPTESQDMNGTIVETQATSDDDYSLIFSQNDSQSLSLPMQRLNTIVNTYSFYIIQQPASLFDTKIFLQIPRNVLPLSLQAVCGFLDDEILLNIEIILDDFNWKTKPLLLNIQHPVKKDSYVGYPLVQTACQNFFSSDYKPRPFYRSYMYLITPSGQADPLKINQIKNMGFDEVRAKNALLLCSNDLNRAVQFLKTGDLPSEHENLITLDYDECPLLYFVLEIAECFLDLQDHCCICRAPISPGLKPTICDSKMCTFQFTTIGVGFSVCEEIQRDPQAADLIFSIFSSAVGSKYFMPRPPNFSDSSLLRIAKTLPAMAKLAACQSDTELRKLIDQSSMELLRWVLLSNRTQMISLTSKMRFPIFGSSEQFLSLISSPQAEKIFKGLKERYGSMYLFHGSAAQNWHSILRNGLKNASGTAMMKNGDAFGSGIYFAHESGVSQGYAPSCPNAYSNSKLGSTLQILALCEIAKVPELLHHGWAHTLSREEACIVRFLLVNGSYCTDVMKSPPQNVPKLHDVLLLKAEESH